MNKEKKQKNACQVLLVHFLMAGMLFLPGCKDDIPEKPVIIPGTSTQYLKFEIASAHHIEAVQKTTYAYELTTTGNDPYIHIQDLTKTLDKDSVVLTFEYKSSAEVSLLQIFFGPGISENRSIKTGSLSKTNSWKTASLNLYKMISELSWGRSGDFLRIDFGDQNGVKLEIRNLYFRAMNESEKAKLNEEEEKLRKDEEIANSLLSYLSHQFASKITEVKVGSTEVSVTGQHAGNGNFSLCEIHPNDTLTTAPLFKNKIPLEDKIFRITLDRTAQIDGREYDRLLSKWVIVKESAAKDEIASHARYADIIESTQAMSPGILKSKKGLGGFFVNQFQADLDLLAIHSITVNVPFTAFMYSGPGPNRIAHEYGNKTYYFAREGYLNGLDQALKIAAEREIVVAAIILVQKTSECADPAIGRMLQHPDFTSEGIYTMPNLTTEEGVNCYAAALDFLASRYNRTDNAYGRIHKWIMHNEVDAGLSWTNMGNKPMLVYLDTYIKSMRLCHNISRQYDANSEVMGSFTHSWNEPVESYSSKEMLTYLQKFSAAEGDFQWGVAYHPYPQDLTEPKTWNDSKATFSINSPLVTFKNLEVIDYWIKRSENMYNNSVKRTLWLSENGTNSKTYSEQDLKEQAAGFAYAWKKLNALDGIDAIQWHNWLDNRVEYGLRIGLRKFPDDETDPGGAKPVWYLYQAAATNEEDALFEPYKSVIGINDWTEIMQSSVFLSII
ncbi:DUF5722 domain-containing protein [uncultured Proteiniphilum sp.]|uniref:DUF5722 domain-containing protein n=1 Tax=uncultured Proteiniphilum sp. TaxID=497637 RepID=UPI0026278311|nr:DUF5722 domain-containing protein [uncultured Proteiniphilum sp.]